LAVKQRKHESAAVSFCDPGQNTGFSKQAIFFTKKAELKKILGFCRLAREDSWQKKQLYGRFI
jgi:hypothetical protein